MCVMPGDRGAVVGPDAHGREASRYGVNSRRLCSGLGNGRMLQGKALGNWRAIQSAADWSWTLIQDQVARGA